ncbi:hypothetical protein FDB88_11940 [Clostridium sporogenes]|uniref:minor capsid protein n=1 Tax=Clostridium sporogenes TaxID=1509 RepID=UPI0013D60980|nr:minor capsid protein [Clostridium sporogenes]NFM17898.1 hypothetical protein [Clostridium sporogenes]
MNQDERFYKSIYDEANGELKEVYSEYKNNRDELLKQIALIMLTYTILDGLMSLKANEKNREYRRLSSLIAKSSKKQREICNNVLKDILTNTVRNTFDFYSYNANLKDVRKIVESNFKGKHFSTRVWENENEVSKHLHKQVKQFLDGKINVNQIKKDIEKTFNTSAYNAKRLTETEVNRCSSSSFDRFCKETEVKKVRYNATLDKRLCSDCAQYHDRVFNFKDKIELPQHPLCRCFYTIEDDKNNFLEMNLQLFGIDEKKELQKLIDAGDIDKDDYLKCYNYFNKRFKGGINTPIGTVYNKKDRFVHIARRHWDMIFNKEIDNIVESLQNPDAIYKTIDRFNNQGVGYVKKIVDKELLTIVRGDIITSYYPTNSYMNKTKRGEVIWVKK